MTPTRWRIPLWGSSLMVVLVGVLVWLPNPSQLGFVAFLVVFFAWLLIFARARLNAFRALYIFFPEEMKHYSANYQCIRYRQFIETLQPLPKIGRDNFQRALLYLEADLGTQPTWSISSNPLIIGLVSAFFAILGGAAGGWGAKYIVLSLFPLVVAIYFCSMVLGLVRTRKSDLLEFKRFLIWASTDMPGQRSS